MQDEGDVVAGEESGGEQGRPESDSEVDSGVEYVWSEEAEDAGDDSFNLVYTPPTDLPSTVTRLEGPGESEVYIVGTAHFSEESNQDVITTIEKCRPHIVCLELCKNRLHVVKFTEEEVLDEVQNIGLSKAKELLDRSGVYYGLFQLAFLYLSAGLTKQLGMAPGGEFRAAYRKGREMGCSFRLVDRSIQITLRRAIMSLTLWKQITLGMRLIFSNEKISKEEVESFKGDVLQRLIEEIAGEYPNLSRVFVDERDKYLARKIYDSAEGGQIKVSFPQEIQLEEGEKVRVVAVVGIGHISGIKKYWAEDVDMESICVIPEQSRNSWIMVKAIKYTLLTGLFYTAYRATLFSWSLVSPYCPEWMSPTRVIQQGANYLWN
eukprot:sb/3465725/